MTDPLTKINQYYNEARKAIHGIRTIGLAFGIDSDSKQYDELQDKLRHYGQEIASGAEISIRDLKYHDVDTLETKLESDSKSK